MYKLKLGETINETIKSVPTIGFNVDLLKHKNTNYTCWDVGGQKSIRGLWHHYYQGVYAVVFVVDSNDRDRIAEAKEELSRVMNHELLQHAKLLIYSNKQDLPNSMSTSEIIDNLQLSGLSHKWHVQDSTAFSGDGLHEGLDWLHSVSEI